MPVGPPTVPVDRLASEGWTELERAEWTPFDARLVAVDANSVAYEDGALRHRIYDDTGLDRPWRIFVAARLAHRPSVPRSRALTAFVAGRVLDGFGDTLAERGFADVRRTDRAEGGGDLDERLREDGRSTGDERSRFAEYAAACSVGSVSLRTRGLAGVRPVDEGYVLAGGAYPETVRDAPDPETAHALERHLEPDRFEVDLQELIRETHRE
ncbi:hypothetical protein HUG10_06310 [Halorarum halophilum]|uniref:Uncharacterized protein n=1 Tax=Halorarum halophilum TaxID=2743090 RepID=A0A7D5KEX1_9EURY|nr:hypothetical protein [Halobaculum halophilum]QLG27176.1 hypothetical protein HUG10_06310 [Halobaculum halophilum]